METQANKQPPKKSVKNYLDMLLNEEGLRTDLKITITKESMIKLIAAFVGAGVIVAMVAVLFKASLKDKQLTEIAERLRIMEGLMRK